MDTTPSSDNFLARLNEAYTPTPDIRPAVSGPIRSPGNDAGYKFLFQDAAPGSAEWAHAHLVGSSAPEPVMERFDGIGPEDFGPVEYLDGRSGDSLGRVSRHARRRIMQSGLEP